MTAREETEVQRQRAEENFDKARRAVDEYLTQITESELLTVPGLQPLREELLEAALKFYTEFTQERTDDPTLQRELASAHYRLGRIYSELGNASESQKANIEAIRLYEELRDAGRLDLDLQVALAWAYFFASRFDDTVKLCQDVLLGDEGHAEARSLLADTYNNLANAENDSNDIEAALSHHRQSFELRESLVRDAPDNPRYLAQLGGTLNNLGVLLNKQENYEEALPMFRRAVEYMEQAYQHAPHSILWGRWLCNCLGNVAETQDAVGQDEEALASYQRLVVVSRKRAFENPAVTSLRGEECQAYLKLARFQQQLGNRAEADRSFREAREVLENIPRTTPGQLYELATVYAALSQPSEGTIEPNEEEAEEQQRHIELTLQTLHQALDAGYSNVQALNSNRLFDVMRGRVEFQQLIATLKTFDEAHQLANGDAGTSEETLADRLLAAELLNNLVVDHPGTQRHRVTLATTLHSIGEIQAGLKQFAEGEQSLGDAITLWRELADAQPDDPQLQINRVGSEISLGRLCHESGRSAAAHRMWQDCMSELEQLSALYPLDAALAEQIASKESQICDIYGRLGAFTFAAEYPRRNLHLQRFDQSRSVLDFGIVLGMFQGEDALRDVCRLVDQERTRTGGPTWSDNELRQLGKANNLLNPPPLPPQQSLEWIERTAGVDPDARPLYLLALAQHRAGNSVDALATFETLTESKDLNAVFAGALIAHGAGQAELAHERLQNAETIFIDYCQQTLQSSTVGLVPVSQGSHWSELAPPVLLRREAWRLISDGAVPDESWLRLMEARADHLLGETGWRDQQLAAVDSIDIDVWLALARLSEELDQSEQTIEANWQRAVDLAGTDPLPWIQRGRWYAEQDEQTKADDDYAHAASLTPNELNRFLEAGWWVVGPYPRSLREFCPPEVDSDPSRPMYVIDPVSGFSDDPTSWVSVPTGNNGTVDLSAIPGSKDGNSVYAMAHVWSPEECTVLLKIKRSEPLRVWVNGVLIEDFTAGEYPVLPDYDPLHRLPIVFRAGRNTILIKCAGTNFTVRIGDSPYDRALLLAEQRRFSEVAGALNELPFSPAALNSGLVEWKLASVLAMHDEDCELYTLHCTTVLARMALVETQDWRKFQISWVCSQRPNQQFDEHAEQLVSFAELFADTNPATWTRLNAALVNYRAGHHERAQSLLTQADLVHPLSFPLQALLLYETGDASTANESLEAAQRTATEQVELMTAYDRSDFTGPTWACWWYDWASYLNLLTEAEQTIRGDSTSAAQLMAVSDSTMEQLWTESPELAAFDHAVLFTARGSDGLLKFPQPLLARARRLTELGRFDEAEADFNQAVQLSPYDPDVLSARAVFLADTGEPDGAAADFHAALSLLEASAENPRWSWGMPIDWEVAQRDDVFDRLATLRPQDPRQLMTRMVLRMQQGNVEGAHSDADLQASYGLGLVEWRAAEALWRGDHEQFERIRAASPRSVDLVPNITYLGLAPTEEPLTTELLELAEQMWREQPQDRWHRRWLGLAQLRAGQYTEAVASLEASLAPYDQWQVDGLHWPLLAIAHHHLGNAETARHWFDMTEAWLELRNEAESLRPGAATGVGDIGPESLLYAMVFYQEAKALIVGPDTTLLPATE